MESHTWLPTEPKPKPTGFSCINHKFLFPELRVRDGRKSSPARDCKELFENNPKLSDGFYWVDPDGM